MLIKDSLQDENGSPVPVENIDGIKEEMLVGYTVVFGKEVGWIDSVAVVGLKV